MFQNACPSTSSFSYASNVLVAGYPAEGWTAYAVRKEKEMEAEGLQLWNRFNLAT